MSGHLENDRSVTTGKMYPIDLAPQKITIVKSMSNAEVKMAHLIPVQTKTTSSNQIISHGNTGSMGLMRTGTQIISPGVTSQPQMIVSGSPILQSTQIVSQGSQLLGPNAQMSQPQLIPGGQILSPGTQIISQGTQLSAQVSILSSVNVSSASGVLVSKGVTSHVPRGLAAGASLAVRPVTNTQPANTQGWSSSRGRGRALVYGCRARSPAPRAPAPSCTTIPTTTVLTSTGVISSTVRQAPRAPVPTTPPATSARPLPLLQRNYQPTKVVGVASVGMRGVANSAPSQLYYEVPRPQQSQPLQVPLQPQLTRSLTPYAHAQGLVSIVNASQSDVRQLSSSIQNSAPRPSILRKRDIDGSPTKSSIYSEGTGWEDVPSGSGSGSTTISAASSPRDLDLEPGPEPEPVPEPDHDLSPRKKPRKQILSNEVRQCEFPAEDTPPSPPPAAPAPPLPKRPSLSSSYVCGWRSTALHFTRPSDVRRREPRARDIVSIAAQRHVLTSAEGWKVHHLTAQMDDLVSLEADVGEQLAGVLGAVAARDRGPLHALQHTLLELVKGNIQRSKIVCEGIQEAREDILRVFKHRNFVSDILTRQADKRCFRKHRSQS
nr:BRD4-interacting chromatin-remodeling complex-associated protein isoform X2 [Danaus plexippus plexippus]